MMPPEDIQAIRGLLQEALRPLSGLPQTVKDLTDEVLALRSAVSDLTPTVERHTDELRGVARALREVEPAVQRLSIIASETVPEIVRRVEAVAEQVVDNHESMKSEIDRVERESQRVGGDDA